MKINPITPNEVSASKQIAIPNFVIEAFNILIAERWDGKKAIIKQDEIIIRIIIQAEMSGRGRLPRQFIFDMGWLNVEPIYQSVGWRVEYDKPGYNENYEAYSLVFTIKPT